MRLCVCVCVGGGGGLGGDRFILGKVSELRSQLLGVEWMVSVSLLSNDLTCLHSPPYKSKG